MKRKIAAAVIAAGCLSLLTACSAQNTPVSDTKVEKTNEEASAADASDEAAGEAYHKITAEEAKKMLDEGDATVVDVRTAEEYAEKHIPGALLVPNETIQDEAPKALPDKDAVLLVHCRTGVRSKQASDKLVELGYTNIYDFGGIVDWPYETESGEAK